MPQGTYMHKGELFRDTAVFAEIFSNTTRPPRGCLSVRKTVCWLLTRLPFLSFFSCEAR